MAVKISKYFLISRFAPNASAFYCVLHGKIAYIDKRGHSAEYHKIKRKTYCTVLQKRSQITAR
jgi:hypothetical protein